MQSTTINHVTLWILIIIIVVLCAWNAVAIMNKSPNDTLGEVVGKIITEHPSIIFIAGVVCGHLFWY